MVAILGNCIYDEIECEGRTFHRAGGVINLSRANPLFDVYVRVGTDALGESIIKSEIISPFRSGRLFLKELGQTSQAKILVNKDGRTKHLVSSCIYTEELDYPSFKYDWVHISYLNKVRISQHRWERLRAAARIISGDSCAGEGGFPYKLDVLFQSIDEPNSIKAEIKVCHSPTFSIVNDLETVEHSDSQVFDRHILGAGDYFASNFINESVGFKSLELIKSNISEIIKKSHFKTCQNIRDFNV